MYCRAIDPLSVIHPRVRAGEIISHLFKEPPPDIREQVRQRNKAFFENETFQAACGVELLSDTTDYLNHLEYIAYHVTLRVVSEGNASYLAMGDVEETNQGELDVVLWKLMKLASSINRESQVFGTVCTSFTNETVGGDGKEAGMLQVLQRHEI